ncbi:MAG: hypothetical protein LBR37_00340, partial [Erysipelotrichaceae bacterium]|nr:hypothetical protein [Erysipelotrichaceae bacterium]
MSETPVLAVKYLRSVFVDKVPFPNIIKLIKDKHHEDGSDRNLLLIIGYALRNYYLFSRIIKNDLSSDADEALFLILFANHFLKTFSREELDEILDEKALLDYEKLLVILKDVTDPRDLINVTLEENTTFYIQERYNIPAWVVKGLLKSYGSAVTLAISSRLPSLKNRFYRLMKGATMPEGFKESAFPGYILRDSHKVLVDHQIMFSCSPIYEIMMRELPLDGHKEIAYYLDSFSALPFRIALDNDDDIVSTILISQTLDYKKMLSQRTNLGFKNFEVAMATPETIVSNLSKKYDIFVVSPTSTELTEINNNPAYLINFNVDDYDALIARQKALIIEATEHLHDGGLIVYFVST